jgi:hypothetical protein
MASSAGLQTDPYYRSLLLERLERLVRLRRQGQDGRCLSEAGRRCIDLCILGTLMDCSWIKADEEAARIVASVEEAASRGFPAAK